MSFLRALVLVVVAGVAAGCTTAAPQRPARVAPKAEVRAEPARGPQAAEPVEAGIVPLTLEQDRQISGVRQGS
ncbi:MULTISPECIES: hypothetical protein [unclassified Aminobacter]|uniref:hypothetical protein n=1 Tax=unclassified Aminobacter TaxID=2644704 RepID=UPI0004B6F16A|nr:MULTISPECIES: hypothetical protein [unclassified Aminobacter]TWH27325.1 hypothetical protein L611_000500001550 [Aminobacter sp. J15]TWH30711.1 hypothetical protein L611_000300000060 [Aminobacter sp. J15]